MAQMRGEIKEFSPFDRFSLPFWKTLRVIFQNLHDSRDLIWYLFLRDLFARYRKSFMGSAWFILSPLLGVVAWVFLNQTGFINPGELEVPYVVYVLMGNSVWKFFVSVYTVSSDTLVNNKNIISQVSYPHEAIFFQKLLFTLANFGVSFLLNIVVLLLFGIKLSWSALLFPLVLIPLMLLGAGIGLISSLISVVVDDLKTVIDFSISLLMWITPVVYSTKLDSDLVQAIIPWNPLTYLVSSARDIVITGSLYETETFLIVSGFSIVFFLITLRLFYVSENRLIERLL